jgi:hypothetical protein
MPSAGDFLAWLFGWALLALGVLYFLNYILQAVLRAFH